MDLTVDRTIVDIVIIVEGVIAVVDPAVLVETEIEIEAEIGRNVVGVEEDAAVEDQVVDIIVGTAAVEAIVGAGAGVAVAAGVMEKVLVGEMKQKERSRQNLWKGQGAGVVVAAVVIVEVVFQYLKAVAKRNEMAKIAIAAGVEAEVEVVEKGGNVAKEVAVEKNPRNVTAGTEVGQIVQA